MLWVLQAYYRRVRSCFGLLKGDVLCGDEHKYDGEYTLCILKVMFQDKSIVQMG